MNKKIYKITLADGTNMELVQIVKYDEEYWFVLRTMTKKELQDLKNRADIDYLAMMSDIEL